MEPLLRGHLISLFEAYLAHTGHAEIRTSLITSGDARFLKKLREGTSMFSVHVYDKTVAGFAAIWPEDLPWPTDIERISQSDLVPRPRKPRSDRAVPQAAE
ncbi:hypothetical protein [Kaistia sp. MMO-174]|uniref:hypothetical protein n=1 Tax=Kaistia sp. MMO-174 TaxID=3081256 RepID=UPI0030173871